MDKSARFKSVKLRLLDYYYSMDRRMLPVWVLCCIFFGADFASRVLVLGQPMDAKVLADLAESSVMMYQIDDRRHQAYLARLSDFNKDRGFVESEVVPPIVEDKSDQLLDRNYWRIGDFSYKLLAVFIGDGVEFAVLDQYSHESGDRETIEAKQGDEVSGYRLTAL
ncbi:MAG: hypothetical protein P8Q37_02950, partial [Porticoccaceae bacterium]|nr:hypothetical protein [Porticoccaceae bacterium]